VARARGWWKRLLLAFECLFAAACGVMLWWATGRLSIPDVGEPFNVGAFEARRLDPGSNAYTVWQKAFDRFEPQRLPTRPRPGASSPTPKPDEPGVDAWLDANREALALFLEGAGRSDALAQGSGEPADFFAPRRAGERRGSPQELITLATVEGARRMTRGDSEGAWACFRGAFRAVRLLGRHGTLVERELFGRLRTPLLRQLGAWADDPRTTPAQLRRALDDLAAMEAIVPDDGDAVKAFYLETARVLALPDNRWTRSEANYPAGPDEWPTTRLIQERLHPMRRAQAEEPQRSRRALKLLTAEWLAYFKTPSERRPPPAVRVVYRIHWGTFSVDFFDPGPGAPSAARAATPWEVAAAFARCYDARMPVVMFWTQFRVVRNKERSDHAAALTALADALYRRDHGGDPPPSPEALVGPYLKALPDDGSNDVPAADDTTPEIEGVL